MLGAVILIPLTELTRSFIGGSGRGVDLIVYGTLIVADLAGTACRGWSGCFRTQAQGNDHDDDTLCWKPAGSGSASVASLPTAISRSRVGRGEIVGLIGPNGAGKSTFFNLIAGVLPPTQGSIVFSTAKTSPRCRPP